MGKFIDLTGRTFDRLTVEGRGENKNGKPGWLCRCVCGNESHLSGRNLVSGNSKSCGCLRRDVTTKRSTKHGHASRKGQSQEHIAWLNMIARCTSENHPSWDHYGGRGITICERWLNSFESFLEDVGPATSPKHSIDRIDVDGNYEPDNVRWADAFTQGRNRRNNHRVTFRGETRCISEWSEVLEIPVATIVQRINTYGWDDDRALSEPVNKPMSILKAVFEIGQAEGFWKYLSEEQRVSITNLKYNTNRRYKRMRGRKLVSSEVSP